MNCQETNMNCKVALTASVTQHTQSKMAKLWPSGIIVPQTQVHRQKTVGTETALPKFHSFIYDNMRMFSHITFICTFFAHILHFETDYSLSHIKEIKKSLYVGKFGFIFCQFVYVVGMWLSVTLWEVWKHQ